MQTWSVMLESFLYEMRRWRPFSLLSPQGWGDTLNFSCYVDLDQASTVYPKKISEVLGIQCTPKIIENLQPQKIFQFCILTLKKALECLEITPKNSPVSSYPHPQSKNSSL